MRKRSPDAPPTTGRERDAGPRSVRLGTDAEGYLHVYHPDRNRVTVLDADGIEHVEHLAGRSIREWEAYVAARRGWRHREVIYVSARDVLAGLR